LTQPRDFLIYIVSLHILLISFASSLEWEARRGSPSHPIPAKAQPQVASASRWQRRSATFQLLLPQITPPSKNIIIHIHVLIAGTLIILNPELGGMSLLDLLARSAFRFSIQY